jgi:hypothetical protein
MAAESWPRTRICRSDPVCALQSACASSLISAAFPSLRTVDFRSGFRCRSQLRGQWRLHTALPAHLRCIRLLVTPSCGAWRRKGIPRFEQVAAGTIPMRTIGKGRKGRPAKAGRQRPNPPLSCEAWREHCASEAGLLTCRSLRSWRPSRSSWKEQWLRTCASALAAYSGATVRAFHPLPFSLARSRRAPRDG